MKPRSQGRKDVLLSGGNPRIARADGDAPVRAYVAGMPGWNNFFSPNVNWITYARSNPRHDAIHRMAQANFNIRGWQGR